MAGVDSKLHARLAWSLAAFGLSLALAVGAAHWYETPHQSGVTEHSVWLERDVACALASSALALALGLATKRWATQPGAIAGGSVPLRALIWALLCVLFLALWSNYLFLLTLLVAPSHAFAALRLLGLLSAWKSELR